MFPAFMEQVKDTLRAIVRISYDGRVYKTFRGPKAQERFDNEVRVLRHLQERGCPFVPVLLESDPALLRIVTTSCGNRVEHLDDQRAREIFDELLPYGVRHDDDAIRNITYRQRDGRFCVIDFEFATILAPGTGPSRRPIPPTRICTLFLAPHAISLDYPNRPQSHAPAVVRTHGSRQGARQQ